MEQYQKIQTVFYRDPDNNYKTLLKDKFSLPEFKFLKDNEWVWTEKIDGTNIRVIYDGYNTTFKGKTDKAVIPQPLLLKLNELFTSHQMNTTFIDEEDDDVNICLYGEGYGAKIQSGGGYIPNGNNFILFDCKVNNIWLNRDSLEDIAISLNIDIVPIIGTGRLMEAVNFVEKGFMSKISDNKDLIAEGLVLKPSVELKDRKGNRIISKIKYKDFKR